MPQQTVKASDLKAVAQHYGLPWPPPKQVEDLERARKEAMLRHHPDRGGSAEDAQRVNQWFDAIRGVREGKIAVIQPGQPHPRRPGIRVEIPISPILRSIMTGAPIPPPAKADTAGNESESGDFVFRVFFDLGGR